MNMQTPVTADDTDLTLEVCADDGSRTEFYQSDPVSVAQVLGFLAAPRLFSQPLFVLASERSVTSIPARSVDMILARMPGAPPLSLPQGWVSAVETSLEAIHGDLALSEESGPAEAGGRCASLVEIHTLGDWMIHLRLEMLVPSTRQEHRQFLPHFFELPVIPFHLKAGGAGFLNPQKITRVTVYPAGNQSPDIALPADLLRCVRR